MSKKLVPAYPAQQSSGGTVTCSGEEAVIYDSTPSGSRLRIMATLQTSKKKRNVIMSKSGGTMAGSRIRGLNDEEIGIALSDSEIDDLDEEVEDMVEEENEDTQAHNANSSSDSEDNMQLSRFVSFRG